jgi:RNA polymerase sigma factor
MDLEAINALIRKAQSGDLSSREQLIESQKAFILRTASLCAKRRVTWNDDEASLGLIAFNDAIDKYRFDTSKTFLGFAKMLIQHKLTDHFRKEAKSPVAVLDAPPDIENGESPEHNPVEIAESWDQYRRQLERTEKAEEIALFEMALKQFSIGLEELEEASPSHIDTRRNLLSIARQFARHPDLLRHLYQYKQLPVKTMAQRFQCSRKVIERARKYLIALILIYSIEDFVHLRSAIKLDLEEVV